MEDAIQREELDRERERFARVGVAHKYVELAREQLRLRRLFPGVERDAEQMMRQDQAAVARAALAAKRNGADPKGLGAAVRRQWKKKKRRPVEEYVSVTDRVRDYILMAAPKPVTVKELTEHLGATPHSNAFAHAVANGVIERVGRATYRAVPKKG